MAEDNIAGADPDTAAFHAAVLDARKIGLRLQQRLQDAAATVNRRAKASSRRRKRRTRHR
jgi:hypothetical protein